MYKPNPITYFPIAVAIVGIAVTWGVFSARLSASENRIENMEIKFEKINQTLTDLRLKVGEIDANVKFIKEKVK